MYEQNTMQSFKKLFKNYGHMSCTSCRKKKHTHSVWKSPKLSHFQFWILAVSTNFVLLKVTYLVILFNRKLQFFNETFSVIFKHRVVIWPHVCLFLRTPLTNKNYVMSRPPLLKNFLNYVKSPIFVQKSRFWHTQKKNFGQKMDFWNSVKSSPHFLPLINLVTNVYYKVFL